MMYYRVQWPYQSGFTAAYGGLWRAGQVFDLPADLAEAINRDSAGVLVAEAGYVRPDPGDPEPAPDTRVLDAAPMDRMARKPGRPRKVAEA